MTNNTFFFFIKFFSLRYGWCLRIFDHTQKNWRSRGLGASATVPDNFDHFQLHVTFFCILCNIFCTSRNFRVNFCGIHIWRENRVTTYNLSRTNFWSQIMVINRSGTVISLPHFRRSMLMCKLWQNSSIQWKLQLKVQNKRTIIM